jgi:hypothetical protein
MVLEAYRFLNLLSKKLSKCGCAIGWNSDHESWDLRVGRGLLTQAKLGLVVEHHGGPKRLVRLSATIAPPNSVLWLQAVLITAAIAVGMAEFGVPALLLACASVVLWVAILVHANQLENVILASAAAVADELEHNIQALQPLGA